MVGRAGKAGMAGMTGGPRRLRKRILSLLSCRALEVDVLLRRCSLSFQGVYGTVQRKIAHKAVLGLESDTPKYGASNHTALESLKGASQLESF